MKTWEPCYETVTPSVRWIVAWGIILLHFGHCVTAAYADDSPAPKPPHAAVEFPTLSAALPYDVDTVKVRKLVKEGKVVEAHRLFGTLAWQAFIALNWPANDRGLPDLKHGISDNTQWRIWDYWRPAGSVFKPDGSQPDLWNRARQPAKGLRSFANTRHSISLTGARDNFEAFTGPLVDQYGKWARFEIRINREEFDYIVKNELYNQEGQAVFSQKETANVVQLPLNADKRHGAIEIKLAWKELNEKDDASRFYTHELEVTPSEPDAKPKVIRVGLVGMHVAMRTRSSPEWIWSTFEQIDNVRSNPQPGGKRSTPSFVDPSYSGADFNVQPAKNAAFVYGKLVKASPPAATTWIESLTTTPVQVKRIVLPPAPDLNPLDDQLGAVTKALNGEVQSLLGDQHSVFQYYELIDVQWPLHPSAPSVAGGEGSAPLSLRFKTPGEMIPTFLINTTMETYFQGGDQPAGGSEQDNRLGVPTNLLSSLGQQQVASFGGNSLTDSTRVKATESCVGCHYSAGVITMFRVNADGTKTPVRGENSNFGDNGSANFSWMLQMEAQARAERPQK
jgi:hypothetical protein